MTFDTDNSGISQILHLHLIQQKRKFNSVSTQISLAHIKKSATVNFHSSACNHNFEIQSSIMVYSYHTKSESTCLILECHTNPLHGCESSLCSLSFPGSSIFNILLLYMCKLSQPCLSNFVSKPRKTKILTPSALGFLLVSQSPNPAL